MDKDSKNITESKTFKEKHSIKYIECEFEIYDYFDGMQDLENKKIMCVGNATERFSEDALRILRCIRFGACLPHNFNIESSTNDALFTCLPLLNNISKERVNAELSRLILGHNAGEILKKYKKIIISQIPLLLSLSDEQYNFNCNGINYAPSDICVRLAILFYPLKNAASALKKLKFSRKILNNVAAILNVKNALPRDEKELKLLLLKYEKYPHYNVILNWLEMHAALDSNDAKNALKMYEKVKNECFYISNLAVNGNDLLKFFKNKNIVLQGKEIGEILESLILKVINNECENKKTPLLTKSLEMKNRI